MLTSAGLVFIRFAISQSELTLFSQIHCVGGIFTPVWTDMDDQLDMAGEKVLQIEAEEAIKDVSYAVSHVEVSKILPNTVNTVFMNLTTKEGESFCVELSLQGFRIVGKRFDHIDDAVTSGYFETIYALLDRFSPEYRNTFGDALMSKLSQLQQLQQIEDESS